MAGWNRPCAKVSGLNHERMYGKYNCCFYCKEINPNAPLSERARSAASSMVSSGPSSFDVVTAGPSSSNLSSSMTSAPSAVSSTNDSTYQRFQEISARVSASRPSGFRNAQSHQRTAGSLAIGPRPSPPPLPQDSGRGAAAAKKRRTSPAVTLPTAIRFDVSLYQIAYASSGEIDATGTIIRTYGTPTLFKSWDQTVIGSDWMQWAHSYTGELKEVFLRYLLAHCPFDEYNYYELSMSVGFKSIYFCRSFNDANVPKKIAWESLMDQDINVVALTFDKVGGKSKSDERVVKIVLEVMDYNKYSPVRSVRSSSLPSINSFSFRYPSGREHTGNVEGNGEVKRERLPLRTIDPSRPPRIETISDTDDLPGDPGLRPSNNRTLVAEQSELLHDNLPPGPSISEDALSLFITELQDNRDQSPGPLAMTSQPSIPANETAIPTTRQRSRQPPDQVRRSGRSKKPTQKRRRNEMSTS